MEGIFFAHARGAARQTQQHLHEWKDEESADDGGQNRRFWTDPRAYRRGRKPNDGRDKLSPKAANVHRPIFALSILDVHENLRIGVSQPPTLACHARRAELSVRQQNKY